MPGRDIVLGHFLRCSGLLGDGRFLDDEGKDQEVREERGSGEEEGVAHADGFGEDAAEQGADDAAGRQGALHDAEAEADLLGWCIERHDGEVHRPEAGGKALEQAHERELARRLDDAAEEVADGEQETRAHGHEPLALRVGHAAPDRRHDGRNEEGGGEDNAGPEVDISVRYAEFHRQVHRQERDEHRVARGHEEDVAREDCEDELPIQEKTFFLLSGKYHLSILSWGQK